MPTVSKRRIALMPVDARPAVREQVVQLVATAGYDLLVPPRQMLGRFREPGDREELTRWLLTQAESVDGYVVSLDMLVYGGLVPSRFIDDSLESLLARLEVLNVLKQRHPHKPIYAFAATMRISNNNVAEEEKSYWVDYGELIWRWSYFTDKRDHECDGEAAEIARATASHIPVEIQHDYLSIRARNFAVTEAALRLCVDGMIDGLILPQDDTAAYGFNIAERRRLEAIVRERGLGDRVLIYPGADEVAHTLCAHVVNELMANAQLKVHCIFSDPDHVEKLTARYEDRPLLDSIKSQLFAVDAEMVKTIGEADVVIAVHTQGTAQGDWAVRTELPARPGVSQDWLTQIAFSHRLGKPLALADLAFANGGDPDMLAAFATKMPLHTLAGYAGWNTASNSIGSLVAQCSLARAAFGGAVNQQVLCLRLLEDVLYQAVWRQKIRDVVEERNERTLTAEVLEALVAEMFVPAANAWLADNAFEFRVASIYLPWQRTFEIGINLSARAA